MGKCRVRPVCVCKRTKIITCNVKMRVTGLDRCWGNITSFKVIFKVATTLSAISSCLALEDFTVRLIRT